MKEAHMTESEIIRCCKNGQISYYNQLIKLHESSLYRFCYHITMNEEASKDLFQDTWMKVMDKIHLYKDNYSFKSWLLTLARNIYRDQYRKSKRRGKYEVSFKDETYQQFIMEAVSSGECVEDLVSQKEDAKIIAVGLKQLKDKFRDVLILYYFEGLTMKEISQITKVPEGTIKSRLHKAKQLLRAELEGLR